MAEVDSDQDLEDKVKDQKYIHKFQALKEHLDNEEWFKAHRISSGKMSKGTTTSMFFAVVTAYCSIKLNKKQEAIDILSEYKGMKPQDSSTAKYLVGVYNSIGAYDQTTIALEYVLKLFPGCKDLSEQLFFSYIRQGELLKQ